MSFTDDKLPLAALALARSRDTPQMLRVDR
jgi:hypothetical protein